MKDSYAENLIKPQSEGWMSPDGKVGEEAFFTLGKYTSGPLGSTIAGP